MRIIDLRSSLQAGIPFRPAEKIMIFYCGYYTINARKQNLKQRFLKPTGEKHMTMQRQSLVLFRSGTIIRPISLLLLVLITCAANMAAGGDSAARSAGPVPAEKGLDAEGHMQIGPQDRCPNCAMLPVRHPKFSCAIKLKNDKTFYFCGHGCLLRAWSDPQRFLNAPTESLDKMVVRNYFTGEQFDGAAAFWVIGSDVVGPMGPTPIPLATQKEVDAFKKRHGGKRVFRVKELNEADWKEILKKPHANVHQQ